MMTMTSVMMFTSLSMTTPTAKVMASSPLTMTMEMLSKVMVIRMTAEVTTAVSRIMMASTSSTI